ncbi:hypothetical protein PR003_g14023 [Phytophthora rubi]|uniref:CCHC-type domain-containing protein n=1 Tax=Phytophthora rubi TaxID=129364 RepID=A0A6A4EVV0_9STRA|nr:hypothetical protein PR003_g14023 [Phytophthora rubi]
MAAQMPTAPAPTMTAPEILATQGPGSDVSMRSAYPTTTQAAYPADDPDDFFDLGTQTGATSRSAMVASNASGGSMTRIRISATSDLKSFRGRDATEEKSRTWLNKLQSAAKRDGMSPAENGLSSQSQYQYCGKGVSVARKYYHATKRSDETPLEYLHRLTVAGIRAKLRVKDDNATERREHVEHFIDTLGSHEQARADQLIMLSIEDGEALERILRARQQSRDHQGKVVYNPSKFRAKTPAPTPAKAVNSLRAQGEQNHDDYAVVSQVEEERREEPSRVSAVTPSNRGDEKSTEPHQRPPCSHCGLTLHKSEDCWTSLTCSHCNGRHPSDRCLKLCKACGEMHEAGACRFEEFFNVMRQWYVPQRHAGMLPPDAEKMLN